MGLLLVDHSVCPHGSAAQHLRREDRPRDPELQVSEERLPLRRLESGASIADSRTFGFGGAFGRPAASSRGAEGASHIFGSGGCGAAIPSIDDFGPAVVFGAAFDSEQGVHFGFRPAASRLTQKYGMHSGAERRVEHDLLIGLGTWRQGGVATMGEIRQTPILQFPVWMPLATWYCPARHHSASARDFKVADVDGTPVPWYGSASMNMFPLSSLCFLPDGESRFGV